MPGYGDIICVWCDLGLKRIKQLISSSLYGNAFYLVLNTAARSITGFVFWAIMDRRFSTTEVGVASALIGGASLISYVASLGFGVSIIRFVDDLSDKWTGLVNSIFSVSFLLGIIGGIIFILGSIDWSPKLSFMSRNYLLGIGFVLATGAFSFTGLMDSAFIAQKNCKYIFWKSILISVVKIILPLLVFFSLGGYGIFISTGIATIVGLTVSFCFFMPRSYDGYRLRLEIHTDLIWRVLPFSLSNYLATLFSSATGAILPLMILDVRGAADSAYFYMAWVIAGVISIIPVSLSTSLFAEGSHSPERLNRHTKRLVWQSVALLCPIVGIIYVLAGFLLNIFGHGYSVNGTEVLRILLLANFPMVVNCFYDTVNAVRKKMGLIILQAFATSFLTLGMSYVFLGRFGVTGVAMAYTLANLIVAMGVWMPLWKFANSNDSDVGPA